MDLVDIGANLTGSAFDRDRDAVIERAAAAGVRRIVVTGTSVAESARAAELARAHPGRLWSTAGVHPHDARHCHATTLDTLRGLAARPEVVAIGECGLDFFRDLSPRPVQVQWFDAQVALAAELGMPVFVHERDAGAAVAEVLARHRDRLPGAVVHCFTGDGESLDRFLALDLHIGITGWICDERRGTHLRDLVGRVPVDRLLVETDAPYLVPRTIRPRPSRNEPAYLPHVVDAIASATERTSDEVAAATTATAVALFGLDGSSQTPGRITADPS